MKKNTQENLTTLALIIRLTAIVPLTMAGLTLFLIYEDYVICLIFIALSLTQAFLDWLVWRAKRKQKNTYDPVITWRDVLDSSKQNAGTDVAEFSREASRLHYPYFAFNGQLWVHDIDSTQAWIKTDLTVDDIGIATRTDIRIAALRSRLASLTSNTISFPAPFSWRGPR